jgi:hypothetical protein
MVAHSRSARDRTGRGGRISDAGGQWIIGSGLASTLTPRRREPEDTLMRWQFNAPVTRVFMGPSARRPCGFRLFRLGRRLLVASVLDTCAGIGFCFGPLLSINLAGVC